MRPHHLAKLCDEYKIKGRRQHGTRGDRFAKLSAPFGGMHFAAARRSRRIFRNLFLWSCCPQRAALVCADSFSIIPGVDRDVLFGRRLARPSDASTQLRLRQVALIEFLQCVHRVDGIAPNRLPLACCLGPKLRQRRLVGEVGP